MNNLPGIHISTCLSERQIRSKYGNDVADACMQLEIGDNSFLQNFIDYKKMHLKMMPLYVGLWVKDQMRDPDTVCLHVVLLEDDRFRMMNSQLCARRIAQDRFEIMMVSCKYSFSSDIKGTFAYISVNEIGNVAFSDYENIGNEQEIRKKEKHRKKLNGLKAVWFIYVILSWFSASFFMVIYHDRLNGKSIDVAICALYVVMMTVVTYFMKKKLSFDDYLYVKREGIHVVAIAMVVLIGVVCLIK